MARTKVPRVRDPLRFRSNEAEAQYADYARKKVEGGRMVNMAELALFNVVGNYNDVEHGQELRITSYVKGVHFSFDYRQLADLLGIPYDGPMVYCAPGEPQFVEMEMRAEIDNQLLRPDRWQMRACYLRPAPRVFFLLTRLGVDLVDEKIQEKTFSSPLDWEAICKMGLRDAEVSDEERNAMVRPHTRVKMADAEAAAAAARARVDPVDDDDRMYMDVNSIPPPSPTHAAGVGTSYAAAPAPEAGTSHSADPSLPPSAMMEMLQEIRDAQRRSDLRMDELLAAQHASDARMGELLEVQRATDQRIAGLTASLQTTQTQIAWLTRVYAEDYDRDREAPPPPSPPAS
ncbi:hypothetical protein NE237_031130 [Protea cynaroides]|uniref:Uncharacterized protein n=1 Tax=Protea cynaroides TaxID=273540 RepID=A0A9Q0R1V7_9MAGN|nr:hypothetical protein NE237_031130 [Protea cynaroides]